MQGSDERRRDVAGTLTCGIIDQLQNERSSGNNAISTWKKVPEGERQTEEETLTPEL